MEEQVERMVQNVPKGRKTANPLSTYVVHLYFRRELLSLDEEEEFETLLSIQTYGGMESEPEEEESETAGSPPSSPVVTRRARRRSRNVEGS